jgi:hypothetical protein
MKKHLLTCAVVLGLIVVTFFIVFTFENVVFALAGVHFLPTSALDRSDSLGKEAQQRIDLDHSTIAEQSQKLDQTPVAGASQNAPDAEQNSDRSIAVAEIAQAVTR